MSYSFQTLWVDPEEVPGLQYAKVVLKYRTREPEGLIAITPQCAFPAEWDEQIDRLHDELEEERKQGHKKFDGSRAKGRSYP